MDSLDYLNLFIVGQKTVKNKASVLMEQIIRGENLNILLRAQSGYGKTYLGHLMGSYIDYLNNNFNYYYYIAEEDMNLRENRRIQFIDEIHLIKNPEFLYPLMDSGEFTFILATNEYDKIKEPLENRCIVINFEQYTIEDLYRIGGQYLTKNGTHLEEEYLRDLVNASRLTPRDVTNKCKEISYILSIFQIQDREDFHIILRDYFNIDENGFSANDRRYLDFLRENSPSGLDTIKNVLNIPEPVIRREIEPFLIRKKLIQITPKGRVIC